MTKQRISHKITRIGVFTSSYGVYDKQGREVGADAVIEKEDRTPDETSSWLSEWVGSKWSCRIHATRDGVPFGAYVHPTYYDSLEEAEAAASKKVRASRRRAVKKYGLPKRIRCSGGTMTSKSAGC